MTSSQPVTTPNALNFTPDNKRAYAYSGSQTVDDSETTLLEFSTNSEYINAKLQFGVRHDTTNNLIFTLYFNNIVISGYTVTGGVGDSQMSNYIPVIIPPFTDVKITGLNASSSSAIPYTACIIGDVYGMTETGYQ